MAVAGKDELGVRIKTQDARHGPDQDVGPLLHHHPADKKDRRVERPNGIAAFDFAGIDRVIEGAGVDAVVDHGGLVIGTLVEPADLVFELVGTVITRSAQ